MQEYRQSKERIMQLDQAIAQLEPWGQFDKKLLGKLERHLRNTGADVVQNNS